MPQFVILEHDHPFLHWDLMLRCGEVLKTWRLLQCPEPGKPVPAEISFDHRLKYLNYEGPISGNRGCVTRWDHGAYTGDLSGDSQVEILTVELDGNKLSGQASLQQIDDEKWVFEAN